MCVVARTHGNDAVGTLVVAEHEQLVERPTLLERCSELQVLELEEHLSARNLRERAGFNTGGLEYSAL